jgi:hypothetical protein
MIAKNELTGKYVSYKDKDGKFRTCKVYRIKGKTLTVGHKIKINGQRFHLNWERIHPEKNVIYGAYIRKKIVEIEWNGRKKE